VAVAEYPIAEFETAQSFRAWLIAHADTIPGIWLKIYKKHSGIASVDYASALDEALCFGWIDGQKQRFDETAFLQKFTPRRPRSMWSKRNIEHITRLTEAGLMTEAGLREVRAAQADGRWAAAYDAPSDMQVPAFFLEELRKHPAAEAFFRTLNKTNTYAIAWRLQTARTDATRQRRAQALIALLEAGQTLH
jgi:uncharacterized protein YdeI (YjbR/CyaY-like superfamily)